MHTHRVEVFNRADDDAIVVAVAHDFHLKLFPSEQRLFNQQLVSWRCFQAPLADGFKFFGVVRNTTTGTTHGE